METDFLSTPQMLSPLTESNLVKPSMDDAGRALEAQFAYMMLKAMDSASPEGGLLGNKNHGIGHFKDIFFMNMAEKMVETRGIGFREALVNNYKKDSVTPQVSP